MSKVHFFQWPMHILQESVCVVFRMAKPERRKKNSIMKEQHNPHLRLCLKQKFHSCFTFVLMALHIQRARPKFKIMNGKFHFYFSTFLQIVSSIDVCPTFSCSDLLFSASCNILLDFRFQCHTVHVKKAHAKIIIRHICANVNRYIFTCSNVHIHFSTRRQIKYTFSWIAVCAIVATLVVSICESLIVQSQNASIY